MEEVKPVSGIKEYIVSCRQNKLPDSKILENLRSVNWPEDVIAAAVSEADAVIKAVPEQQQAAEKPEVKIADATSSTIASSDLFTQPDIIKKTEEHKVEIKEKATFSFYSLISLLFSPIPFVGLFIGVSAFESARKNKQVGGFIAILAILINVAVILFIGFVIYQILSLDPSQLTGFSKFITEKFNLA